MRRNLLEKRDRERERERDRVQGFNDEDMQVINRETNVYRKYEE
jgi:hypothetical protein